ncbi:hypothetical protein HK100_003806 [Physocladia obscura]|uniref:D-lactate dehydratase n=1 Tax=Physocladia obscura TaxID=109957 RepID=A0AAD5T978_9FUNG|nr:hypothetical protein HK100_003806 [Physocladia obscura]
MSQTKNVLVLCADGSEEMETVIIVDVLRRAQLHVTLAKVAPTPFEKISDSNFTNALIENAKVVKCSRGVQIVADTVLAGLDTSIFDAIVLPGGLGGATVFAASTQVHTVLRDFAAANKLVAAICAAPIALASAEVFHGRRVTSYPGFEEKLGAHYKYSEDRVVVDGNLVTSRGPGSCFEFALAIIAVLCDDDNERRRIVGSVGDALILPSAVSYSK